MKTRFAILFATICALTLGVIDTAAAYVGPGAGLSLVGAVWGLLLAIFAALGFVMLWPLRRLLRRRRAKPTAATRVHPVGATAGDAMASASSDGAPGEVRGNAS
jgi:hypothetical protein